MNINKKSNIVIIIAIIVLIMNPFALFAQKNMGNNERRILVSEYRDKMMAGWIGQMAGVGWGAPTEFQYKGVIIPEDKVPEWKPEMINVFNQDDLYVEMTFLRTLEEYGFDVSIKQAGIDFANSGYMLWHANRVGRENLLKGIAPPNSGHPHFSTHADDIDYQIEADFSGLIAPGLPNTVIAIGEKFGHLMNYGDGVYGGQFVGGLYAEAFFEDDPEKLVDVALKYIPEGSQYAETIRDVIKWHSEQPDDWQATWQLIEDKYNLNPDYRLWTCSEEGDTFNIDAKLNGAYIAMGLLYGNDDLDRTTVISMQCGQDSDCNPSNAAGALFTTRGFKDLPDKFISGLNNETKFSFTNYNFPELIDVTEKLATEAIIRAGGRVEVNASGEKEFVIPIKSPMPSKLEQSHNPGPISNIEFTKEELKQINGHWIFKFSLIFLLVVTFLLFKENRNLKATAILIPLGVIFLVAEFFRAKIGPEGLAVFDIVILFESLAVGFAILLLLGKRLPNMKWYISFIGAGLVLAIVGYAGITGINEGRYIAATD
ncbi:MAG: ADP-ribosylglycohydrolase family protein, partial [Candidatus Neomarinimicrobiota bacterium]